MLGWDMGVDSLGLEWAEQDMKERLDREREQAILVASAAAAASASGFWARNSTYYQNS